MWLYGSIKLLMYIVSVVHRTNAGLLNSLFSLIVFNILICNYLIILILRLIRTYFIVPKTKWWQVVWHTYGKLCWRPNVIAVLGGSWNRRRRFKEAAEFKSNHHNMRQELQQSFNDIINDLCKMNVNTDFTTIIGAVKYIFLFDGSLKVTSCKYGVLSIIIPTGLLKIEVRLSNKPWSVD